MPNDPIIQKSLEALRNIEEFCNENIKPWEPNAAYRAQCLFRSLAQPYIDIMCDYLAIRPKSSFQISVFKFDGERQFQTDMCSPGAYDDPSREAWSG